MIEHFIKKQCNKETLKKHKAQPKILLYLKYIFNKNIHTL